jgi:signal transduction histidine kinase
MAGETDPGDADTASWPVAALRLSAPVPRDAVMAPGRADPARPALWYRRHPTVAVAVATGLFLLVFALRIEVARPGDAISVLYVFPVALLAVTFGLLGGLGAAAGGFALVVLSYAVFHNAPPDALGWSTQGAAILVLGALLGHATDRRCAIERWALTEQEARLRLEEVACRERAALEINDSLIQGMSAAKWLIEQHKDALALDELSLAIDHGEQLVTDLLLRNPTADSRRVVPGGHPSVSDARRP